jgi:type I restriction enzyme S subunit
MSFPRYPKYKASGVEWLGDVPEGWEVKPLKCNFQLFGGSTPKSENEAFWNGDIPWATPADLGNTESLYISDTQRKISADGLQSCATSLVPPNSIILSTRASIGALAITQTAMCTNQGSDILTCACRIFAGGENRWSC